MDMEGEKGNGGIQKNSLLSMTQEKMAKFIYGGYQKDKLEQVIRPFSRFILLGTQRTTREAEAGGRGDCRRLFGVREHVPESEGLQKRRSRIRSWWNH